MFDLIDIEEKTRIAFPFHSTMTPRGVEFYDTLLLNSRQQTELNKFKIDSIRENNCYLEKHPEVCIQSLNLFILIFYNFSYEH